MTLTVALIAYLSSLLVFLAVDFVWLRYLAGPYYRSELSVLLLDTPRLFPALLFYLLFVFGNLIFVVEPAIQDGSLLTLVLRGGLYGLVCYATYDLTNYSTLKEWPLGVTLLDLAWGTTISIIIGLAGYYSAVGAFSVI